MKHFWQVSHLNGLSPVCLLLWNFKLRRDEKHFWQVSHLNRSSCVCSIWWLFKLLNRAKLLWQVAHLNGFSPVCTLWWIVKEDSCPKHFWQVSHLNGPSPVCSIWWFFKLFNFVKLFWQVSHLNGLLPVCIVLWIVKWPCALKHFWHILHLNGPSLVCCIWWLFKLLNWVKHLWQVSHLYGFSSVCTISWFFKSPSCSQICWQEFLPWNSLSGLMFPLVTTHLSTCAACSVCITWPWSSFSWPSDSSVDLFLSAISGMWSASSLLLRICDFKQVWVISEESTCSRNEKSGFSSFIVDIDPVVPSWLTTSGSCFISSPLWHTRDLESESSCVTSASFANMVGTEVNSSWPWDSNASGAIEELFDFLTRPMSISSSFAVLNICTFMYCGQGALFPVRLTLASSVFSDSRYKVYIHSTIQLLSHHIHLTERKLTFGFRWKFHQS